MNIQFILKESIYDCKLQITDIQGRRYYYITALSENELLDQYINIEVFSDEFKLTVIPIFPDYKTALDEFETSSLTNRIAEKAVKFLCSSIEKMLLQVGCEYHITGLNDGDRIDITLQYYTFGTFDRLNLLELIPMMYIFFEVSQFNQRFELTNAFETNRKDVIKAAKTIAFTGIISSIFTLMITYPIQVSRIKRLSKNKKIFNTLHRFNSMSETERQKVLDKNERFINSI